MYLANMVFSSPKLKAHLNISDHIFSVVRLSCLSVCLSVNFSQFQDFENQMANFNQTWQKDPCMDSKVVKIKDHAFFKGDKYELFKIFN